MLTRVVSGEKSSWHGLALFGTFFPVLSPGLKSRFQDCLGNSALPKLYQRRAELR